MKKLLCLLLAVTAGVLTTSALCGARDGARRDQLSDRIARLGREVARLEDEDAIENLQRTYGFYVDKSLWTQAAALFTDAATLEVGASGVFAGKARILAYLQALGSEFPQPGRLYDQMQLQPIISVAPDGRTAKARWRLFAQEATWHEFARWGVGVYENSYVKQGGVWKIEGLHVYYTMYTPYEQGWGAAALAAEALKPALAPDRPPSVAYQTYPSVFVVPFHYEHPVTGASAPRAGRPGPALSLARMRDSLASLDHRLALVEDAEAIERLHAIYGYYLAANAWDDLAGLFADTGTIEIALRGIYVGPESVRRSLELYGAAGTQDGLLHNHMQLQPVIHVADDGRSAKMRSRAFSIMGQSGAYSMWMGGIYENEFVREGGVWKLRKDHVINTYFATYAVGWKELQPRNPPGASATIPPDLPPSIQFELYPSAFLPAFHYPNPVTGEPIGPQP